MHLDQYIMTISYFCCMLLPNQIVSFLKAYLYFGCQWASLVAQMVKNLPAMRETWVRSLGWENPLEEGMVTHSSILAWRIPKNRGSWQATVRGVTKSQTRLSD